MIRGSLKRLLAQAKAVIATVAVQDALELHGDPNVSFVDVRETVERERTGTIPGAVHAPRGFLEFMADPEGPMHDEAIAAGKRLLLFCASGGRSALAAKTLLDMGFTEVASIAGGLDAWRAAGGAVEPLSDSGLKIAVRKAKPADAGAIAALIASAYAPHPGPFGDAPAGRDGAAARIRDHAVWVAQGRGELVGALVLHPQADHMSILELAVLPEAQGQGIGKLLLEFAEQETRRAGLEELRFLTKRVNRRALAFLGTRAWIAQENENPGDIVLELRKQLPPV